MAINLLTKITTFLNGNSPGLGTPALGSTFDDEFDNLYANDETIEGAVNSLLVGWYLDSHTWEYVSADAPSYVFRINADMTAILTVGQKIKYTQTTVKYGIITAIGSYSGGYTNITIYAGGSTASPAYAMTAAAITNPYYAAVWRPLDFPMNPDTWSYIVTDTTLPYQSSPTINTYYNLGSIVIAIPIGLWDVEYKNYLRLTINGASSGTHLFNTLSTTNNSESNSNFTCAIEVGGEGSPAFGFTAIKKEILNLAAKTNYYLNAKYTGAGTIADITNVSNAAGIPTRIKAVCQYL